MQYFFFLSGYGLMESEAKSHLNITAFLKRRLLKIYLPVLLMTFLWMLFTPFLLEKSPFGGEPLYSLEIGGKALFIRNILWSFGDGVLWFIKVLVPLYAIFYIFSIIYQRNKSFGLIALWSGTILLTIYVFIEMVPYEAISILYFTLGVQLSISHISKAKDLIIPGSILLIVIASSFCFLEFNLAIHSLLNAILIGLFILIFTIKRVELKIPSILAILSFDLYLTHHKVLMALKDNSGSVELWSFCILTMAVTVIFYLFRTKIIKI